MRTRLALCGVLLGTVHTVAASGLESDGDFRLQGFLSQGFVQTSANRFFGPSDDGSWDFREIGLNASFHPRPDLLFSGQLLSRKAGDMYDGQVRIDYGLIDYTMVMHDDKRMGLRLGRLKNPLGLYNDTRDVPFTRPSIFLPQSIYFDKVRNLELSTDGLGLYGDWQAGYGDFYLQLHAGWLDVDVNVENAYLFADWPGDLENDAPWLLARLVYEYDGGRMRFAASAAQGALNYKPASQDYLAAGEVEILFWILSAQYNEEQWSLTAEYMNEPVSWRDFGPNARFRDATAEGWYVQGAYRPFAGWELLVRYDASFLDKSDRGGDMLADTFSHNGYAKDWTFGVRWDVTARIMLRAEYHLIDGASWLSSRENDLRHTEKDWDMFALFASYRF